MITCHSAEWESRIYSQPKQVLDLANPEGWKAELTYVMWKRTVEILWTAAQLYEKNKI